MTPFSSPQLEGDRRQALVAVDVAHHTAGKREVDAVERQSRVELGQLRRAQPREVDRKADPPGRGVAGERGVDLGRRAGLVEREGQIRRDPVQQTPDHQRGATGHQGMIGDLVPEDQLAAGDVGLLEIAERLARIVREPGRQQGVEVDLTLGCRRLGFGLGTAQTDAPGFIAGQDQERRLRLQRGGRQHGVQGQGAQADADLDFGQVDQDLAVGSPGLDAGGDQLDHPMLPQADAGVVDREPDPLVARSDRTLEVGGEPGQLDRAGRQAEPEGGNGDDRGRHQRGRDPEQRVCDPQDQAGRSGTMAMVR